MTKFFLTARPYGLAGKGGLGRSALNSPRLGDRQY